jgi:uncharacterized protein YlxW (UPF0749 family)
MTSPDGAGERRTFTPDFLTELFRNPLDPGYTDAAARKAAGGGPTGAAKRMISGISALTLVALGFLLVVAYQQTVADAPAESSARATLVNQVQSRRTETTQLQDRADQLRSEVATLRERELGGAAVAQLRDLEATTGLAPVRGSGAKITLKDGPTSIDPVTGVHRTDALVKDTDLQLASNALWAAGAEAIAVNGQRLTATSTIRQAGEAILVDFRPVTSPYEVLAIGPDEMADDFREGHAGQFFKQLATRYGIAFDVQQVDDLSLAAAGELKLRFATPSAPPAEPAGPAPSGSGPAGSGSPIPTSAGTAPSAGPPSTPTEGG